LVDTPEIGSMHRHNNEAARWWCCRPTGRSPNRRATCFRSWPTGARPRSPCSTKPTMSTAPNWTRCAGSWSRCCTTRSGTWRGSFVSAPEPPSGRARRRATGTSSVRSSPSWNASSSRTSSGLGWPPPAPSWPASSPLRATRRSSRLPQPGRPTEADRLGPQFAGASLMMVTHPLRRAGQTATAIADAAGAARRHPRGTGRPRLRPVGQDRPRGEVERRFAARVLESSDAASHHRGKSGWQRLAHPDKGVFKPRDPHLGKVIAGPAGVRLNRSSPAHRPAGTAGDRPNRWNPLA
jgi:hypothetical protein